MINKISLLFLSLTVPGFHKVMLSYVSVCCSRMYRYALCLSYHSHTLCMSIVRPGDYEGSAWSQKYSDALLHQDSNQGFTTFRLLAQLCSKMMMDKCIFSIESIIQYDYIKN